MLQTNNGLGIKIINAIVDNWGVSSNLFDKRYEYSDISHAYAKIKELSQNVMPASAEMRGESIHWFDKGGNVIYSITIMKNKSYSYRRY